MKGKKNEREKGIIYILIFKARPITSQREEEGSGGKVGGEGILSHNDTWLIAKTTKWQCVEQG